MKPLTEMTQLRHQFASARLKTAFTHIRSGKLRSGKLLLLEASRLAPTLPHPYVMLAKLAFWEGDLVSADANIALAEERGFPKVQSEPMRSAIEELRLRARTRREEKAEAAAGRKAFITAMYRIATNETNWLTDHLTALLLFFVCILVTLGIAR